MNETLGATSPAEMNEYEGGAKRAGKVPYYRIIPAPLMKRMAQAFTKGHDKYSEGVFTSNWKKGNEQFYAEAYDHAMNHLIAWWTCINDPSLAKQMDIDQTEDHLGHALCNLGFLAYGEEMGFFDEAEDESSPGVPVEEIDLHEVAKELGRKAGEAVDKMYTDALKEEVEEKKGIFSGWFKGEKEAIG